MLLLEDVLYMLLLEGVLYILLLEGFLYMLLLEGVLYMLWLEGVVVVVEGIDVDLLDAVSHSFSQPLTATHNHPSPEGPSILSNSLKNWASVWKGEYLRIKCISIVCCGGWWIC